MDSLKGDDFMNVFSNDAWPSIKSWQLPSVPRRAPGKTRDANTNSGPMRSVKMEQAHHHCQKHLDKEIVVMWVPTLTEGGGSLIARFRV